MLRIRNAARRGAQVATRAVAARAALPIAARAMHTAAPCIVLKKVYRF